MKKICFLLAASIFFVSSLTAQKIIPLEYKGKKYEVLDMTSKGKITWGGNSEQIAANAAKSESNGEANTAAIVAVIGKNPAFDGKPYAAKLCSEVNFSNKDDWYLPAKDEADAIYGFKEKFNVEERGSIWTSTEVNGTQAITKYWYNGTFYNSMKVEQFQFVCIRKIE